MADGSFSDISTDDLNALIASMPAPPPQAAPTPPAPAPSSRWDDWNNAFASSFGSPMVQGLLGMGAGFGRAAMPTRMPTPFGAVLGEGMSGLAQGIGTGETLTKAQIDNQRSLLLNKFYQDQWGNQQPGQLAPASGGGNIPGLPAGAQPMMDANTILRLGTLGGENSLAAAINTTNDMAKSGWYWGRDGQPHYWAGSPASPQYQTISKQAEAGYVLGQDGAFHPASGSSVDPATLFHAKSAEAGGTAYGGSPYEKLDIDVRNSDGSVTRQTINKADWPTVSRQLASQGATATPSMGPQGPPSIQGATVGGLSSLPNDQTRSMAANAALRANLPPAAWPAWLATVHHESGWNINAPNGTSGEIGPGQIKPSTGKDLGYTPEQLRDPLTNLTASAKYFGQKWAAANGDVGKSVAGYNTGDINGTPTRGYLDDVNGRLGQWGYPGIGTPTRTAAAAPPPPPPGGRSQPTGSSGAAGAPPPPPPTAPAAPATPATAVGPPVDGQPPASVTPVPAAQASPGGGTETPPAATVNPPPNPNLFAGTGAPPAPVTMKDTGTGQSGSYIIRPPGTVLGPQPLGMMPPPATPTVVPGAIAGATTLTPQQQANIKIEEARRMPFDQRAGGMHVDPVSGQVIKNPEVRNLVGADGVERPYHVIPASPYDPPGTPGEAVPIDIAQPPGGAAATQGGPGAGGGATPPGGQAVTKIAPDIQATRTHLLEEFHGKDADSYIAAQNTAGWLNQIDHAGEVINQAGGAYQTGPYAHIRLSLMSNINDAARTVGVTAPFNEQALASAEELKKATTTAGFELSSHYEGHARQAAATIENATSAVPGLSNSPKGLSLVSAGIHEGAQAAIDMHEYKQARTQGQDPYGIDPNASSKLGGHGLETAEVDFFKKFPPTMYSTRAISSVQPIDVGKITQDQAPALLQKYLPGTQLVVNGRTMIVPNRDGAPPMPAYLQHRLNVIPPTGTPTQAGAAAGAG